MPYRTDDLVSLLTPRDEGGGLQYAQGKLLAFNPVTLENEVAFRGTVVRNLNVSAAAVDAAVWQPGDLLELRGYAPRRGPSVWWIGSRILTPGPGAAAQLTAATAAIIADRVHIDSLNNPLGEFTASTIYTDLATVGPTVSDVDISPAGKALVILSASLIPGASNGAAAMSFQVTGATSLDPDDSRVLAMERGTELVIVTTSAVIPLDGLLNPGLHTFQAKYKTEGLGGGNAGFGRQSMTVVAY